MNRRSIRARRFVVVAMLACGCSATSEPPRADLGAHAPAVSDSVSAAPLASSGAAEAPAVRAVGVAVDDSGACAILEGGEVSCWGGYAEDAPKRLPRISSAHGLSLGGDLAVVHDDGTATLFHGADLERAPDPLVVDGGISQIAQGYGGACVLRRDHKVACYPGGFRDERGALKKSVLVSGLGDAEAIGAAADRGCAIVEEGRVACWEIGGRSRAVAVPGITGAVDLRVSPNVGCASDAAGKLSCFWLRPRWTGAPIAVGEASSFAISAGTSDGALVCRARGAEVTCDRPADLAGSWTLPSLASGKVVFERRITSLSTGKYAACALDEAGAVACWGLNIGGVLGRPDTRFVQHPTAVPGIPDMKDVAVGDRFTCGLAVSGEVLCWGRLAGFEAMEKPPPPAEPTPVAGISGAKRLIANSDYACAYSDADEATCFFAHPTDGVYEPARVPILDRARFVRLPDLGFANAVAAIDENGQLLVGPTSAFDTLKGLTLAPVAEMVPAEQLSIVSLGLAGPASSYGFVLSRGPKGHVVSVEIGDFGARPPKTLAGLDGALALNDSGHALLAGGKVVAGRLGRAAEVIVAESPLVTLSDGSQPCGLTREGTYGCMTGDRFVPVFEHPVKVASSGAHDCELGTDRRIRCRGSNTAGECGVSIGLFSSDEPREIPLR